MIFYHLVSYSLFVNLNKDKDTGTEQASTRWSQGVHQFLQLKHARQLTAETLKAVFISNISYFKRYKGQMCGLTGSLGSHAEQNILEKVYNVRFFSLPRFKPELLRLLPANILTCKASWHDALINAVHREIRDKLKSKQDDKRRAVLIICENVKGNFS